MKKKSKALLIVLILAGVSGLMAKNIDSVLSQNSSVSCANKTQLFTVANRPVWKWNGLSTVFYKSGMTIDADGAPKAYHPKPDDNKGLDALGNAGHPGNWWALVTDNGKPSGNPVIQIEWSSCARILYLNDRVSRIRVKQLLILGDMLTLAKFLHCPAWQS